MKKNNFALRESKKRTCLLYYLLWYTSCPKVGGRGISVLKTDGSGHKREHARHFLVNNTHREFGVFVILPLQNMLHVLRCTLLVAGYWC